MNRFSAVAFVSVLATFTLLLARSAAIHSPTFNEIGHVPAGIAHWRYRMFELYRVNPPLPRMLATFPLLFSDVKTDWANYPLSPLSREEIPIAIRFAEANGTSVFRIFTLARLACIPFCLLGGWICYLWARELWGESSGWIALLLWCTSPFILGHGPLVMPDVPAAATGVCACYLFWNWFRHPTWMRAVTTGIALGTAELCKTTLLVFFILWPAVWCIGCMSAKSATRQVTSTRQMGMLSAMLCIAVYVVNVCYGFSGSFRPVGQFQFVSHVLNGAPAGRQAVGNRFVGTRIAGVPIPLPADYVQGIDLQRADFEAGDRSYRSGHWQQGGWWDYHLYGLAIKTPLGMLALLGFTVVLSFRPGYRARWRDELFLLIPSVAIIGLVSSQTGFSNHVRYTIPALPFFCIWCGKCARSFDRRERLAAGFTAVCLVWNATSSLSVFPHSISYFNELSGGPKSGHEHLLDSNIAWGQDLLLLKNWLDRHPDARPIQMSLFGWVNPRLAGIEAFAVPPTGPNAVGETEGDQAVSLRTEWYAIDVNFLHGTHWSAATSDGRWPEFPAKGRNFEYFRSFEPVDRVGYSILIYRLRADMSHHVRNGTAPVGTGRQESNRLDGS